MDLSVIIPVYNEEQILGWGLKEVVNFFSTKNLDWELIVVNDGSEDGTKGILERIQSEYQGNLPNSSFARRGQSASSPYEGGVRWGFRVIHFPRNRGKGAAVRAGFKNSTGDYMLFFDIDLSTPLSTFDFFWSKRNAKIILIGSRALSASRVLTHQVKLKESAGKFGNLLTRLLLPLPFRDTQCGFKLYPAAFRTLLHMAMVNGAAFDIEWLLIAQRQGFTIEELPVVWTNRLESRFGLGDYISSLRELMTIKMRDVKGRYEGNRSSEDTPMSSRLSSLIRRGGGGLHETGMHPDEFHRMHEVEASHFWFWAKLRFLKMTLRHLRLPRRARILDVGCGTGLVLEQLYRWGFARAQGTDTSPTAISICQAKGLDVRITNDHYLPYPDPDATFDCVICLDVLEHIEDDCWYIRELYRLLKPHGMIIVMVPAHPRLWSYHDEALGHARRYIRSELKTKFLAAGFKRLAVTSIHTALLPAMALWRMMQARAAEPIHSDTRSIHPLLNTIIKLSYLPELLAFKMFKKLPFGSSFLLTATRL